MSGEINLHGFNIIPHTSIHTIVTKFFTLRDEMSLCGGLDSLVLHQPLCISIATCPLCLVTSFGAYGLK